jgi:hypothetical protein
MRTIAWFHFVAGDAAIDRVASLPQLCNLDQATIYRYRTGEISPRAALLNDPDEWFRAARVVYDVGPFNVALWDAMWGELRSADGILAARLTPRGEWANEGFFAFLFDDELLGNIVSFRQAVVREDAVASDLFAFATAIRMFRVNVANGTGAKPAMKELLQSGLALPGARGLLTRFGLLDVMREWVKDITKGIPDRRRFSEPRPWMEDEYLFQELCLEADRRLAEFRRAIFGGPLVTH